MTIKTNLWISRNLSLKDSLYWEKTHPKGEQHHPMGWALRLNPEKKGTQA